jgi:preprotein translocase subunit SecE
LPYAGAGAICANHPTARYLPPLPQTGRAGRRVRKRAEITVAKTSPTEFFRQVQAETKKVVWPTRRETVMTAVMVVIMTTILALFFLGVDSIFEAIVRQLLKFAQSQ